VYKDLVNEAINSEEFSKRELLKVFKQQFSRAVVK
jgi:hypothetical protein